MTKIPFTFAEAMHRIHEATGTRTQVEIAETLNIRQSSISDAKRRNSIPDSWLIALFDRYRLNPDWVRTGTGHQTLTDAGETLGGFTPPVQKRSVIFSAARKESVARKSACQIRKGEKCLGSECMAFGRAIGDASADYSGMCLALPHVQVSGFIAE